MSNSTLPDIDQTPTAFDAAYQNELVALKQDYDDAGNLVTAFAKTTIPQRITAVWGNLIDGLIRVIQRKLFGYATVQTLQALGTTTTPAVAVGTSLRVASGSWYRCATVAASSSTWVPVSGEWNVLDFGCVGDGSTNNATALTALIASLPSATGTVLFPPGTWYDPLGSTRSWTELICLKFRGGILYPGVGTTEQIAGPIDAPANDQIFVAGQATGSGGGYVTFVGTGRAPSRLPIAWWGARRGLTGDSSIHIRQAYAAAAGGARIVLGGGSFRLDTQISNGSTDKAFLLEGDGIDSTTLAWNGGASEAFLLGATTTITSHIELAGFTFTPSNGSCTKVVDITGGQHTRLDFRIKTTGSNGIATVGVDTHANMYDLLFGPNFKIQVGANTANVPIGVRIERGATVRFAPGSFISGCRDHAIIAGSSSEQIATFDFKGHIECFSGTAVGYPGDTDSIAIWLQNVQYADVFGHFLLAGDSHASSVDQVAILGGRVDGGRIGGFIDCGGQAKKPIKIDSNDFCDVQISSTFWRHNSTSGDYAVTRGAATSCKGVEVVGVFYGSAAGGTSRLNAVASPLPNSATPSVGISGGVFTSGGTTAITSFADARHGQRFTFIAAHSVTLTHGTNLRLNGATNFAMAAGDVVSFVCRDDGGTVKAYEAGRCDV